MEITDEQNRKFSFTAVRERGGDGVEVIYDVRMLLYWLEQHDSQLNDWAIYPSSDLAVAVNRIRNERQAPDGV